MARRPRVFTWSDGFHSYFVAATSRAKALAAWGFDRDLFREGAAKEVTEGAGHDAALARPGEVIEEVAGDIRKLTEAAPAKAKSRSPGKALIAARAKLAAVEEKLAALDEERKAAEASLLVREEALARERKAVGTRFAKTEENLRDQRTTARAAVKRAGG